MEEEDRESLLAAGCDEVMSKPFDAEDLFASMRRHGFGATAPETDREEPSPRFGSRALPSPALAGLSADMIADIRALAETANLEGLLDIADRLEARHPEVRTVLRRMAEIYAYDEILRWCEAVDAAPSEAAEPGRDFGLPSKEKKM